MSLLAQPAQNGVYRIKRATSDLYLSLEPNGVALSKRDEDSKKQRWKITRSTESSKGWQISSLENGYILAEERFNLQVKPVSDSKSTWYFGVTGNAAMLYLSTNTQYVIASTSPASIKLGIHKKNFSTPIAFTFDLLEYLVPRPTPTIPKSGFQERFFTLPAAALEETYDIIIVGTGMGGGVLAGDLFDTNSKIGEKAKSILVVERGNLIFHSHCLNASRPSGLGEDRGQQNDTFFSAFKNDFKCSAKTDPTDWKGGPMYCLGGRTAAWGLFAPRVHDHILENHFHKDVTEELLSEYYEKAEQLMKLSLPKTQPHHQHLIDRLNMKCSEILNVQWQWGRIASEFSDPGNFDFAEGAYSTIDKLLEIAMSKPKENKVETEHKNFKIMLGMEVRKIIWADETPKRAIGICARDAHGVDRNFRLKERTREWTPSVVLSAGSVNSPAILLRSNVNLTSGLRLTDHDIFYASKSFRYRTEKDRELLGAMKLQTYAKLPKSKEIVLVNMSIDASTFLPRKKNRFDDMPKLIIVFMFQAPLKEEGHNIELDSDEEPVITITRTSCDNAADRKEDMENMVKLCIETVENVLKVDFVDNRSFTLKKLELGGVAHELGTVPMPSKADSDGCLDKNLKLRDSEGIYLCDLSVLPYSPEANPSLTLAALALRLSRTMVPRLQSDPSPHVVRVINHSGRRIKVFVSNSAAVGNENATVELGPGADKEFTRKAGHAEAVLVYRLIEAKVGKNTEATPVRVEDFNFGIAELILALPGKNTAIL